MIRYESFEIATYKWGNSDKKALLIHGWEGRAANFGAIVPVLIEKGYEVHSFDSVGHGDSSKKSGTLLDFPRIIMHFLKEKHYDLLLTHSMGSIMTFYALQELQPYQQHKMLVMTTPDTFHERLRQVAKMIGLGEPTVEALIKHIRKNTGFEPLDLNAHDFVKNIQVNEIHFIHDKADSMIPIQFSHDVQQALGKGNVIEIEGTGHFRMLWSEKVLDLLRQLA